MDEQLEIMRENAEHEGEQIALAEAIVYLRELFEAAPHLRTNEGYVPGCGPMRWKHLAAIGRFAAEAFEAEDPCKTHDGEGLPIMPISSGERQP